MRVERSVTIERAIEEVFEYISMPENDPEWVSVALRHERTSPGPMCVGATTREEIGFLGRRVRYTWEVSEYDPPRSIAFRSTSGPVTGRIRMRLEPAGTATTVTLAGESELKRVHRVAGPLLTLVVWHQYEGDLCALKQLLESRANRI